MSLEKFKQELGRVFDDDLHTKQWHNYVDYAIIGLILLSTLEVFLSTYDGIVEKYGVWLKVVDYFTTAFFTIEVTLRIWAADQIDPKYKGFWGRVRYCFSFYGFIDIISTYPFYLHFFMPVPYVALKAFRIARLMRIFRYIKAFGILKRAMSSKKDEMLVSLEFLTIITVLLSFVLFFVEHEAQPDVYDNGWTSVLWAFAQYIGDPGGFADTPPVTFVGRLIACIIGVLGIAIFAVPAGLIASAFSEVMEEDAHDENSKEWAEKLYTAFERKQDRPTGFQIAPRYVSVVEAQARLGLKTDEIVDAVTASDRFRLINLAVTQTADEHPIDRLAVECFVTNTPYGCCIDRGSNVTIVTLSNIVDPIVGWWGYYLAKIGGFNYVSRETGVTRPYSSFYTYNPEKVVENQDLFMADMNRLMDSEEKWVIVLMAASGANEPAYPTQFHFDFGAHKGCGYEDPSISIHDVDKFEAMYCAFESVLKEKYQLYADKQKYHAGEAPARFYRHLDKKVNAVSLRVAWSVTGWDMRAIALAKELAECINANMGDPNHTPPADLKVKDIGYCGY